MRPSDSSQTQLKTDGEKIIHSNSSKSINSTISMTFGPGFQSSIKRSQVTDQKRGNRSEKNWYLPVSTEHHFGNSWPWNASGNHPSDPVKKPYQNTPTVCETLQSFPETSNYTNHQVRLIWAVICNHHNDKAVSRWKVKYAITLTSTGVIYNEWALKIQRYC